MMRVFHAIMAWHSGGTFCRSINQTHNGSSQWPTSVHAISDFYPLDDLDHARASVNPKFGQTTAIVHGRAFGAVAKVAKANLVLKRRNFT
jgi:hypothetical protein